MQYCNFTTLTFDVRAPSWILAYATVDVPIAQKLASLARVYPNTPIFGCTSFSGVFSPAGFTRGMHGLVATKDDGVRAMPACREVGAAKARDAAHSAAREITKALGETPTSILMHATPGFEERILEGIDEAFKGNPPPVYGGSAADDEMKGDWKVFCGTTVISEGFVLAGFCSRKRVLGSFASGYAPTHTHGIVTCASNRIVQSIDHAAAAEVYNRWTYGSIQEQLAGGVVLHTTALKPLGRVFDKVGNMPRYLLSHPHQVLADGALWFFCEINVGDELTLMLGNDSALAERANQVVTRAMTGVEQCGALSGGILVYCAGCVGVLGKKVTEVANGFHDQLKDSPFVGPATFGEEGCFPGRTISNRHGNLMCNAVLFEG